MSNLPEKIQNFAVALMRISVYIRRSILKERLERIALDLVDEIGRQDFSSALRSLDACESIVRFSASILEIEPANARKILRELDVISSTTRNTAGLSESGNLDIDELFSEGVQAAEYQADDNGTPKPARRPTQQTQQKSSSQAQNTGNGTSINAVIRQSKIIDLIRQANGSKVHLRDLMSNLPDVSERTLRYDIQKLCNQGVVEKVGNGGPATYYASKNVDN